MNIFERGILMGIPIVEMGRVLKRDLLKVYIEKVIIIRILFFPP
jgi:hypothetical protein